MIHLFNGKKRILFFPVGFANSVARWILGVHSPSGTISIKNTATPGDNGSLALDVNVDALRHIMAGVIDDHDLTEREIKRTKDIVHGAIDGTSLIMGGEHISVSMDWLQQNIQKFLGDETEITHDKITDWDAATAGFLTDDDYDTLSVAITDLSEIVDEILTELDGYLTVDDIGVTVAEEDHTHTTVDISNWGTATADFLTDADMSAYALDADLAALEEDVADIADLVDAIDTDLYDASGNKAWVDLTTNQTINGTKSFTSTVFIRTAATQYFVIENTTNFTRGYLGLGEIWLDKNAGQIPIHFRDFNRTEKARIYYDYTDNALKLLAYKPDGTWGPQNKVCLGIAPTDTSSTSELGIATLGWVNNYFSRKTHHHDDVYSKLGHTHSGYASTNHTHTGYASSNHNHNGVYANATHQHVAADITDLESAIDGKITTFSNTLSGTYTTATDFGSLSDLVGDIDADLSDVIDYVDSMDEDIADLADWYATGVSGTLKMCTGVTWNGTKLAYTYKNITVTNGLITNIPANDSSTDINTPAVITWS